MNIDEYLSTSSRYFIGVYIQLLSDCKIFAVINVILILFSVIDDEVD